jgi:UPF0716 family protein affecting phage T7 exclusion
MADANSTRRWAAMLGGFFCFLPDGAGIKFEDSRIQPGISFAIHHNMFEMELLFADILPLNWSVQQIAWSVGVGVVLLVVTAVAGALFAVYLPADYLTRASKVWDKGRSAWEWGMLILKNLVGMVLIVAGVLMLVLLGQGVLTMIIGLLMLNFPGKRKLVAGLIRRTKVLGSINLLRTRYGQPPLKLPGTKAHR